MKKRIAAVCACGDHSWIALTKGYITMVSPSDAYLLNRRWHAQPRRNGTVYAMTSGSRYLHRDICAALPNQDVDHWNNIGLDNRRHNLRVCTRSENLRNSRKHRDAKSSRFKGVYRGKRGRGWWSMLRMKGKTIYLGQFEMELDAVAAYDNAARKYYGRFARTNLSIFYQVDPGVKSFHIQIPKTGVFS